MPGCCLGIVGDVTIGAVFFLLRLTLVLRRQSLMGRTLLLALSPTISLWQRAISPHPPAANCLQKCFDLHLHLDSSHGLGWVYLKVLFLTHLSATKVFKIRYSGGQEVEEVTEVYDGPNEFQCCIVRKIPQSVLSDSQSWTSAVAGGKKEEIIFFG